MSIKQRIQLLVVTLMVVLFSASAIIAYYMLRKQSQISTDKQTMLYLGQLEKIITLINENTEPGFDHNDYIQIKPYFTQNPYFKTDYPFLIDISGNYLIHLYKEGQKFPREQLKEMLTNPEKKGVIIYEDYKNAQQQIVSLYFKKIEPYNSFVAIPINHDEAFSHLQNSILILLAIAIACTLISFFIIRRTLNPLIKAINTVSKSLNLLSTGQVAPKINYLQNDEVGQIVLPLNSLIDGVQRTTLFAKRIGKSELDVEFITMGENDELGNSLLELKNSMLKTAKENEQRKLQDEQRNWSTSGIAKFGDILRQNNNNLQFLSDSVIQNLVNYLNANQGGLFILNESDNTPYLELISAFAFNRKKVKTKTIHVGEGLVGNCAIEKQTIYLKEIPEDYIEITSGLGDAPPSSLLIVPLKLEDKIFGVVELASFNEFQPHEIEFVEIIGESIASTLSAVKNNIRTNELLEQSQQQREEMAAQEEEMRQNMEEMQATQEEMARKTLEMEGMTSAINESLAFAELTEEGNFIMANPNFLSLTGYGKTEIENKRINDFIHSDEAAIFNKNWKNIVIGEPFKGTLKWVNHSEEELYVLASISPAFDESGRIFKIFFLGQDVSESKKIELKAQAQAEEIEKSLMELEMEQELSKQREEEMDALLQALDTTCLVTQFEPDGRITYINNKNVETLGDPKSKIEGKLHSELDFQAKNNPQEYKQFWEDLLLGIQKTREFSLNVSGKNIWISEHYTPIKNTEGKVIKIINIGIDISASKDTEKKLRETVNSLKKDKEK
ncbi:MAG TPA: PAS domain-containing protein [Tenuifilaceae bacterium]|nr:PAS domain-containing protein [Tenuifilaceae bacterium]HPE18129.1 PAS domain-containing protein [Tenuifilaceae bacterium]HPJ45710.1 PAS domain-containing protein [Tenuifilaceae bacterium]HPQ34278.1 PAS domain-containing protein [Tenuifilaceae bacterium]HRX67766.1 PAS domain-containing protein [Tenuifilaceae bacterium]